jgi:hypothetical protein
MPAQIIEREVIVAIEPISAARKISRTRQARSSSARMLAHVISAARS